MVQALTWFGPDARERNLADAYAAVRDAAGWGADLVVFPENYPGAWRAPVTWVPTAELADMARGSGVYVVGGFAEPMDAEGIRCYNTLALYGPDGTEVGRYRRTTPAHAPWIYQGGRHWDFDWQPADDVPVFDTDLGRLGLLRCSEVYATELPRIVAAKGADLAVLPAGLTGPHSALYATWRTLVWARAIENIMYTAMCVNIPRAADDGVPEWTRGMTMVCGPEQVLLETTETGLHVTDLDLVRLRELREASDRLTRPGELALPWATNPGNLRDWRRAAVLDRNGMSGPDPR